MNFTGKSSKVGAIILNVVASIILLAGMAILVYSIVNYFSTVSYYVDQGYPSSMVHQQLFPSVMLTGFVEPIVFCGIGAGLYGIAAILKKVSMLASALLGNPSAAASPAAEEYETEVTE